MQRYNLTKTLFDFEEEESENSANSVIYISSDSENEATSSWDSDWSTDTEAIIDRIEREVKAVPIPIAGRGMMSEDSNDEMVAGPSNAQPVPPSNPKLGFEYFNREMCLAPSKKQKKSRVELCTTVLPVLESPLSTPDHVEGQVLTPLLYSRPQGPSTLHTMCRISSHTKISVRVYTQAVWCVVNQGIR